MLLYRVAPYLASAKPSTPGHPEYLHKPQGLGRIDNPGLYDVWYLSFTEAGAIGETFQGHPVWRDSMFDFKPVSGARYALHTFSVSNNCRIVDLDDAKTLLDKGLRPTQVITPNRSVTQMWARDLYNEVVMTGPAWHGVKWWSAAYCDWPVAGLFREAPKYIQSTPLSVNHHGVKEAAQTLRRSIK